MKKCLTLLMLLLLAAAPALAEELTIVIATDLHYLSPALTDNGSFFTSLVEEADGKTMLYSDPLCEAFTEQIIARRPDCLILSGDLTFNGEKQSHADLAAKLRRIEAAGIPVLVMPGNHDLSVLSYAYHGEGYSYTEGTSQQDFRSIYADMGFEDALVRDPASLSYIWALSPQWRILMLDANTPGAEGTVREETLRWALVQLMNARDAGARVIAVSHQNLHAHSPLFSSGFVITNHEALAALYDAWPVALNLSGHMHLQHSITDAATPEVVTSALAVHPSQYGVITLGSGITYATERVNVSAWAHSQGLTDPNLTDFAGYAERFFKQTALRQAAAALAGHPDADRLAAWFADLNVCYFSGRMDQADLTAPEADAWLQQPGFLAGYVSSILAEKPLDHTRLTLPAD